MAEPEADRAGFSVTRLFYVGPFITMFDRGVIGPLLVAISLELRVPLAAAAMVATVYYVFYGGMQLVFGILSDRVGRVRVMRIGLAGAAGAGLLSTIAPSLGTLIAARAAAGGLTAAILPASIVYIGDALPFRLRQRVLADLLAAAAVGSASGALIAGALARFASWRISFLIPAIVAGVLFFGYRRLPESSGTVRGGGPLAQLGVVARRPWAVFLIALALIEGVALQGLFTFLAPALQAHGFDAAIAGLIVTGYGLTVLVGTRIVKQIALRVPAALLVAVGGAMLVAGFVAAALDPGIPGVATASVMAGGAYAFMHSTLQSWATDVVPNARGTLAALFVTAYQLGAAAGVAAVAGLVDSRQYSAIFWIAAAVATPVLVAGTIGRARYSGSSASEGVNGVD
ncbi:MAG TPA: MFS transporter [Candidatus Dormibacteraeota bacterium]|nr:MFS transporter [Candidatus Dormibacteraeota bacterium]